MNLSTKDITDIIRILDTCMIGNINAFIIENGQVRSINEDRTCILISTKNVPTFPKMLALTRISELKKRLGLFDIAQLKIDAKEHSTRDEIQLLDIVAGKSKTQFRCTSPALLGKVPKGINDPPGWQLTISSAELELLLNASRTFNASIIQLVIRSTGEVGFSFRDEANDQFTLALEAPSVTIGDDNETKVINYNASIFIPILKSIVKSDVTQLTIGSNGTIKANINTHDIVIMPNVDSGE